MTFMLEKLKDYRAVYSLRIPRKSLRIQTI